MSNPYVEIAHHLPNEVKVGGALITMVEPHPGYEAAYNRWYEDDHFYSGAMAGPWIFSGRRFVATRELRSRRAIVDRPLANPPDTGCYLSLYWKTAGQEDNAQRWAFHAMNDALIPDGRVFTERSHVYTAHHRFLWSVRRDDGVLRPETSLAHPFSGLWMEVVDAPRAEDFQSLVRWLEVDCVPATQAGSDSAICLAFTPLPFAGGRVEGWGVPEPEGLGRQVCLLWFLDNQGGESFAKVLAAYHDRMSTTGLGELRFSGPFIPTVPGTDRYVSELR